MRNNIKIISSPKKKNFFKVYLHEEYIGSVPKSFLPAELFIDLDTQCSEEYVHSIKEWVYKNALGRLVEYLAKMEKTVFDCKQYLKKIEVPDSIITAVIKEAQSKNWLSDGRYAMLYTEEAILAGKSPLEIKHKLLQKRIDTQIIDKAIKEFYTQETKTDILENLITTLVKRHIDLAPENVFEKVATVLYRKGFQYSEYEDLLRKAIAISFSKQ